MQDKILETYTKYLEKSKKKQTFAETEEVAVQCAREINQLIMQGFVDAKGTGYVGSKLKMSNGKVAKFKGYDKKNFPHFLAMQNALELLTK